MNSTIYGATWEEVTRDLPVTKDFLIEKDSSVTTLAVLYFAEKNSYFGVSFVRAKRKDFAEYIQNETTGIWFPYSYFENPTSRFKYRINKISRIQDNLIVAVGGDKIILISRDNGSRWEMKSFFRPLFRWYYGQCQPKIQILNRDTVVVVTDVIPFCFYSIDGGATFLPISRKQALFIESNLSFIETPVSFYPRPFGLITFKPSERYNNNISDTLVLLYSNDLGKSFSRKECPVGYAIYNDSIHFSLFHSGFLNKETNEFLISLYVDPKYDEYSGPKYVLCRFDDKLRLVDTTLFYFYLDYIFSYSSGLIFSDGTYLYKSSDYGKTFIPLSKFPKRSYYNNKLDFVRNQVVGTVGEKILVYESTPISGRLLILNIATNSFDSLSLIQTNRAYLLASDDTVFISTEKGIYIFPDIENAFKDFEFVPLDNITSESLLITQSILTGSSNIILTLEFPDVISQGGLISPPIPLNLAIMRNDYPYLRVEPEVEKDFAYLFAFPPYPNPAQDWVNVHIYWDSPNPSKDVNINLFDAYGRKCNLPIKLQEGGHNAIVSINTSTLALGTYYLRINYGYKTIVYPVLVVR